MVFGYCISVFERYCASAVYTCKLPIPSFREWKENRFTWQSSIEAGCHPVVTSFNTLWVTSLVVQRINLKYCQPTRKPLDGSNTNIRPYYYRELKAYETSGDLLPSKLLCIDALGFTACILYDTMSQTSTLLNSPHVDRPPTSLVIALSLKLWW